jgi:hypothetical protein
MYLYVINMTFDEVHKQDKKYLWDRKNVCLGIITNQKLPSEVSLKHTTLVCVTGVFRVNIEPKQVSANNDQHSSLTW